MGIYNDDISLKLAKAVKQGFLPDVYDSEVDILREEAVKLFNGDIVFDTVFSQGDSPNTKLSGSRFRTLTVLTHHFINLASFQNDLDFYQEWNYSTVTFDDVQKHMEGTYTLPDKPLLITFDDGILSQYAAVQELNSRSMKSTLFVATGWIDGTVSQASGGFAEATALTWAQIIQMKAWGCDIQSHTVNHQDQQTITTAQVTNEFVNSKARVEAQVPGQIVSHMAYPYGSWNEGVKNALKWAGCKLARVVRIAGDGTYPGPNQGRLAIASTSSPRFEIPTAGTSNGDIQQANYYRTLSSDPELVADFGFEAGGKGWILGSGFSVDTADKYAGTKSLTCTQGTSTVSSRPSRAINAGRWPRAQLKAWIKTVGLPAGTISKVQIQQLRSDSTVISTIDAITVTGNNGAWTEYTYELIGDAAADSIVVFTWLQGNASPTGTARWDNISLKKEAANSPYGGLY